MEQSVEVKEVEVNGITYISTDYHISEYEKAMEYGHTQGKARGYVKGYNKGFEDGKIVGSRNSNKVSDLQERERQLQEKAWDEGYVSAIEDYLAQGGEFIGNVGCYKFGAVDDWEHTPNKETQEAMQEALGRDSDELEGVWVAKDGSGKLKVLSVYEGVCDVKLVEHVSNSYLCVGDTATISTDDLKEHWNKEGVENTTEDEQLEKELSLVEKYPHYYKDIRHLNIIDIYRFFDLFNVKDPCLQHSIKKMAVGGKRGSKDYEKDIKEAMDTLSRWEYMQEENKRGLDD